MYRNFVLGAGFLIASSVLLATPISICGTGFAASCGAQISSTSGLADGNFVLVANADGASTTAFVTLSNQFPISTGAWVPDTATGEWIGPATGGNEMVNDTPGAYNYQETFSLAGFDVSTVTLSGFWDTDNTGCIFVNGVSTGECINNGPLATLTAFSITNGTGGIAFVQGSNTITFETLNAVNPPLNPTGLFVELSGTGTLGSPVPEPASFAFVGLGLAAFGLIGRKLRS